MADIMEPEGRRRQSDALPAQSERPGKREPRGLAGGVAREWRGTVGAYISLNRCR